jgi:cardiolipin synthase A/B
MNKRKRRPRPVSRKVRNTYGRKVRRVPKGVPGLYARVRRFLWSWWVWAILAVVLAYFDRWNTAPIAGILALVAHVTAPSELPPIYGLDHEFAVDSDEFLATVAGATGVGFIGGNAIEIYENGDRFYPAMLAAIERAEHSITIEAYIYWEGDIGRQFAEALAAKSRQGLHVKVLLDAIGSSSIGEDILKLLSNAGCEIAWYHPIRWYTLSRYNNRTHRKSLIIDGRVAFTGGAGIADHWLGDAQDPDHWRDTQMRVEGPGVAPLQAAFAQNWLETTGELVNGRAYYPVPEPAGDVDVQVALSSPETGASAVRIMYYLSIICARRSIYIANPYFVPDQVAHDILVDAKKRGVDVKVMVAGRCNDSRLARYNSTRLYGDLLRCGVEIFEYQRTMLHQKVMIVDGTWATVGTTNFDNRSFSHNAENNVCFTDRAAVAHLTRSFGDDLKACERVELKTWRRRPVWMKGFEKVASLLQDQV